MNYRHGFHAGNFADLAKHAAVLDLIRRLREHGPLNVIDTHAGAGQYDLSDPDFARSKEAEAGIQALLSADVPPSLKPLADYVRVKNTGAGFRDRIGIYPGSPVLIIDHLPRGSYIGAELRQDDFDLLDRRVGRLGEALMTDGYELAVAVAIGPVEDDESEAEASGTPSQPQAGLFVLIDPPFERPDDYRRIVTTMAGVLEARPDACALIWLPLKDLETLDAFLRHLERGIADVDAVVAEIRLRPLWNPMKMNGCALVCVNPPEGFAEALAGIAADTVAVFGDAGGAAKSYAL